MRVRGFTSGGGEETAPKIVTETGLAVVHENELVYPAAGSAAQAVIAADDARGMTQVIFPVEVVVSSAPQPENGEAAAREALDAVSDRLSRIT